MINITSSAIDALRSIAKAKKVENFCVRLICKGGGCQGIDYQIEFQDEKLINDYDKVFSVEDIKLVCDPKTYVYVSELTLDCPTFMHDDTREFKFVKC